MALDYISMPRAYDARDAELALLRPRCRPPVGRGRRAVGHAGDRLWPLLLVPDLLRGAAGGVRLVARGHGGGVLGLLDRPGAALARHRDPRGPLRSAARDPRGDGPARRRVRAVEPDRVVVVALPCDGRARRGRGRRGGLG